MFKCRDVSLFAMRESLFLYQICRYVSILWWQEAKQIFHDDTLQLTTFLLRILSSAVLANDSLLLLYVRNVNSEAVIRWFDIRRSWRTSPKHVYQMLTDYGHKGVYTTDTLSVAMFCENVITNKENLYEISEFLGYLDTRTHISNQYSMLNYFMNILYIFFSFRVIILSFLLLVEGESVRLGKTFFLFS